MQKSRTGLAPSRGIRSRKRRRHILERHEDAGLLLIERRGGLQYLSIQIEVVRLAYAFERPQRLHAPARQRAHYVAADGDDHIVNLAAGRDSDVVETVANGMASFDELEINDGAPRIADLHLDVVPERIAQRRGARHHVADETEIAVIASRPEKQPERRPARDDCGSLQQGQERRIGKTRLRMQAVGIDA